MLEEPYINRLSEEYQNQITRLLAQIGSRAKLIYGFDETVGNIKDYYPAIKALGYPNAKIVSNLTNCIDYVQNVGPCIVRSDDKNNPDKSNAWVIDGIKVVSDNKYRAHCESINDEKPYMIVEKTYIQCNWGDGGYADGYFLAREKRYSDASLTITGQNEWKTTEWTISSQGFTTSTMQFIINFK